MKILIIGCNGQLGKDCYTLLSPEHELVCSDIANAGYKLDIADPVQVDSLLSSLRPQVLINCAAYTDVDKNETETELAWKINADGPGNLARTADRIGARLVHVSTDYVFDGNREIPLPYFEDDPVSPISQYGKSKLAGEQAVIEHCPSHLILRTAWLYSAHGPNFLKTMLRLALQDATRELNVVNDQYGSLTWSYTLAKQIKKLIDTELSGIFHTTAEGYSTWYEGACYFLDRMGVEYRMAPCTTAEYPTPATRPANSILENKNLKDAGLNCFVHWQADIDSYVDSFKESLLTEAAT